MCGEVWDKRVNDRGRQKTGRYNKPYKAVFGPIPGLRRVNLWDHLRKARVFKSAPAVGYEIKWRKWTVLQVETQGYQQFPLFKPVVGQNTASHAVPVYRASTYLVSAFPAHSTSFSLKFNPQWRMNVYWIVNHNFHFFLIGIQFVSSRYDSSWLIGCKTSSSRMIKLMIVATQ